MRSSNYIIIMALYDDLIELSLQVEEHSRLNIVSELDSPIELSGAISLPYTFTCEALHPGEYKGYVIEENDIIQAQNSIFESDGVFHNYEINKDHKNSRKAESSVDDLLGKITSAKYDYAKQAYILSGEIYDESTALKIAKKIIKYVSLRINPGFTEYKNGKQYARNLRFEELSFVRAPGDNRVKIY